MKKTSSELNMIGHKCSWHFQCRGESWPCGKCFFAEWKEFLPAVLGPGRHTHIPWHSVCAGGWALMDGCLAGRGCPSLVSLFNYTAIWMLGSKTAFSPRADFHLVCHVNSEINCSNCLQTSSNSYFFLFYWIFIKLHVMSCLVGKSSPVCA